MKRQIRGADCSGTCAISRERYVGVLRDVDIRGGRSPHKHPPARLMSWKSEGPSPHQAEGRTKETRNVVEPRHTRQISLNDKEIKKKEEEEVEKRSSNKSGRLCLFFF